MNSLKKKAMVFILTIAMITTGDYFLDQTKNSNQIAYAEEADSISQFPESYQKYLRKLKASHPNWIFKPFNTGLEWKDVVAAEFSNNKSLMAKSANSLFKSNLKGDYNPSSKTYIYKDSSSWVRASQNAVAYFVDPRNWLNAVNVFMFEDLTYQPDLHTQSGVEKILAGTFMGNRQITYYNKKGKRKKTKLKYSEVIIQAAKNSGVSPYYLASKIRQEVGANGSGSTSGKFSGYKGYYNFYNIGASDSAVPIANGLSFAKKGKTFNRPWNTPMRAIMGGASYISSQFIGAGQTNGYIMRFNVNSNGKWGLYSHQYMTNVSGASQESVTTYNAHVSMGTLNETKVFKIPVFKNMPEEENMLSIDQSAKSGKVKGAAYLRSTPNISASSIIRIPKNAVVSIEGGAIVDGNYEYNNLKFPYWFKVRYTKNGQNYNGYLCISDVNVTNATVIGKKQSYQLSVTQEMGKEEVYYLTSDPSVATVSSTGNIRTQNKNGSVTIYAFLGAGAVDAIKLKVSGTGNIQISKKSATVSAGEKITLTAKIKKATENKNKITWRTADSSIASVDGDGIVTAKKTGKTVIIAKATNGIEATCDLKVNPGKVSDLKVSETNLNRIKLTWKKAKSTKGYIITRKVSGEKKYKQIANLKGGSKKQYTDKHVSANKTYTYRIQSYRKVGRTMYYSGNKSLKATAKLTKTEFTESREEDKKIELKWKKISDATGYQLYRKEDDGEYQKLETVGKNQTSFSDETILPGKAYEYYVVTVKKAKKTYYSDKSQAVRVTVEEDKEQVVSKEAQENLE